VKAQIIRAYANKYGTRIFVETGTFFGDMLAPLSDEIRGRTFLDIASRVYGHLARTWFQVRLAARLRSN